MTTIRWQRCAQCARWCIRRNPTYLLSAACIALAARLYLVHPDTRAGKLDLILVTFAVLQAYLWAVIAITWLLHRTARSPEDEPSLLLVGTLFWTGPMAATAELTAHQALPGSLLAVGACLVALLELAGVRRFIKLRLSLAGRAAACACVALLAAAPPMIKVPATLNGHNELSLYGWWWLLGIFALLTLRAVRFHVPGRPFSASPARTWGELHTELVFLGIVIATTAAHLTAMNYAFFGHARLFYAAPLIMAIAAAGIEYLGATGRRSPVCLAAFATLPAIAVVTTVQPFDPIFPARMLPRILRDPMAICLALAGLVWVFGYARHRVGFLLHLGNIAIVCAAMKLWVSWDVAMPATVLPGRELAVAVLYALALYLAAAAVIRRSRWEGIAALLVQQVALTVWVWDRDVADVLLLCLSAGWSWLAAAHLACRRPALALVSMPIAFLMLIGWAYEFNATLLWTARAHSEVLVGVVLIIGVLFPRSGYRRVAAGVFCAEAFFYLPRWATTTANPAGAMVVLAGFGLLLMGALVSWHKRTLLDFAVAPAPAPESVPVPVAEPVLQIPEST